MRRVISLLLCAVVLLLSLAGCGGCGSRAPELEEIYDRVVELVEASYRLNTAFYGAGLPVYDKSSPVYNELYGNLSSTYQKEYSVVDVRCGILSVDMLKAEAEKVYSPEVLERQIYPAAFDGLVASIGGVASIASARYQEDADYLYCIDSARDEAREVLIFDYSTMQIIRPSNAQRVLLTMDAWEIGKPDAVFSYRLTIVNVDGVWLLDKVTV